MDLEAQVAALKADLEVAHAKTAVLEEVALTARNSEIDAYVEDLQAKSAEAQAPIDAEKLQAVVSLFNAGQDDTARLLGDTLLSAATAKSAGSFTRLGVAIPKSETPEEAATSRMRNIGYDVKTTSEGAFVSAKKG